MQAYRKADLVADLANGAAPGFVLFLDYRAPADAPPTKACLSQWWPAAFELEGLRFPTSEHYMMHAKALHFGDIAVASEILLAPHPYEAKLLGRHVRHFDDVEWNRVREAVVTRGCLAKFAQNDAERAFLLCTGNQVLVEASADDPIWGSGTWASSPTACRPKAWPGLNLLGFILMDVRAELARLHATKPQQGTPLSAGT